MYKYLKGKINIDKSISFLCGPYFDKNNSSDRRSILLKFLKKTYHNRIICLIIDDFLISDNIRDPQINIQLLEEIFAAISSRTYIFLDTMSAASELGLFANHSTHNMIHVFLPYSSDILYNNIGYFVKNIIIDQNKDKIKIDYYRPKILKKAIATDYVVEYYEFINDEIPSEITKKLIEDSKNKVLSTELLVKSDVSIPYKFGAINYTIDNNNVIVTLSVKTLFYLISSEIYERFKRDELKDKKVEKCSDNVIREICDSLRKILRRTLDINWFGYDFLNSDILIKTIIDKDILEIVKHIIKFIVLYHENEPRNGHLFIKNKTDIFLHSCKNTIAKNGINVFGFDESDYKLINDIIDSEDNYFEEFTISKHRKKRLICKYVKSDEGDKVSKLHKKIGLVITKNFRYSEYSYAYQKGKSAIECVAVHRNSVSFVKFDVYHFFNSMDIEILIENLLDHLQIGIPYKEQLQKILTICTHKGEIPLGFNISPLLSEMYMKFVDDKVGEYARDKKLIYTRYADDILISSNRLLTKDEIEDLKHKMNSVLKKVKLRINTRKYRDGKLINNGQHFKYLGINIVQKEEGNILTVGKVYKNYIAKRYLKYLSLSTEHPQYEQTKFYEAKRIAGQISFVKQVEGMEGYWKIIKRIKTSSNGRVDIKTDKINFNKVVN